VKWDEFATEKCINCVELELWVDMAMAMALRKEWIADRKKALNRTSDPNNFPIVVKALWESHINATVEVAIMEAMTKGFADQYQCKIIDKTMSNVSAALVHPNIIA